MTRATIETVLTIALALPTLWWLWSLWTASQAPRQMPPLRELVLGAPGADTTVSAVVPARDEGPELRRTLTTLIEQDYPNLEVVAVDDRSSDETGAIMDELAARYPDVVTAVHIEALPTGWLGKVHALQQGAERASGDWLLFADADTRYAPGALARLVAYAEQRELDALSALPRVESGGSLIDAAFSAIAPAFNPARPVWRIDDPSTDDVAASGAFVLVRSEAFRATPGFAWLRLEVADDWGLMLLIKRHGGRCAMVNAVEQLSLRWYGSYREMVERSQKNTFAVLGRFSLWRSVLVALALCWFGLGPWLALAVPNLASVGLGITGIAAMTASTWLYGSWGARPRLSRLWPTLGLLALAWIALRSGVVGWRLGGIEWRGTFYDSATLRDVQKVRM